MTRYDLLKMNTSVLQIFIKNKIDINDVVNLSIFEEYTDMRNRGLKYAHVVQTLAEKYHKGERSISNIVNRMKANIEV